MNTPLDLAVPSGASDKFLLAGARRTTLSGQPVQRFLKDLIPAGSFVHPATGEVINATPERLDKWARNFARMQQAGVKVPVPVTHTKNPEANRGWVEEVFVSDGKLFGALDLIGDDAIALASRVEVSIGVHPNFKDAQGTEYGEALDHVALVTDPVIPGQGPFLPIAASRDQSGVPTEQRPLFVLSLSQDNPMDFLKSLQTLPGFDKVTEADWLDTLKTRLSPPAVVAAAGAKVSELETALAASRTENETLKGKVTELSASAPKPLDPYVTGLLIKNATLELSRIASRVPKAVLDKLAPALVGTAAAPSPLLLSRDGTGKSQTETIIDALAELPAPVQTGETHFLSRTTPDDKAPALDPDLDKRIARLNGTPTK
jgi:hypothetical protein